MKLPEIMRSIECISDVPDVDIIHITNDSRKVQQNGAFVCIKGKSVDGHDYAKAALNKGAAAVIVQRDLKLKNQVIVRDTAAAYSKMSANFFGNPAESLKLIGITGTNGKTTTSYILKQILEYAGYRVGLIGTICNMIADEVILASLTTPEPFELQQLFAKMVSKKCDYVIMEVSSQALEQERVASLCFEASIFTNLTQDHLDYHGNMQNYSAAKRRLFEISKKAVINLDDSYAMDMVSGLDCEVFSFSVDTDSSDCIAKNIRYRTTGVSFELLVGSKIGRVNLPLIGTFSVYNALGAAACALTLNVPFEVVVQSLSKTKGVTGRLEVVPTGRDFTVVIDYAHTPDGLKKVLLALKNICKGRLVALFGCGGDRDRKKRPLMGGVAASIADFIIVTSDNPRTEDPMAIIKDILVGIEGTKVPHKVIADRKEAIFYAIENAQPNDIIVLAGKGHETYQILKDKKIDFDERLVVAKALAALQAKESD